ncbi:putative Peptidyl-glycine alpha-amidating monooxygenase protein, partial [Naja naja]
MPQAPLMQSRLPLELPRPLGPPRPSNPAPRLGRQKELPPRPSGRSTSQSEIPMQAPMAPTDYWHCSRPSRGRPPPQQPPRLRLHPIRAAAISLPPAVASKLPEKNLSGRITPPANSSRNGSALRFRPSGEEPGGLAAGGGNSPPNCDGGTCTDTSDILYAWARNAPPTRLPKGVGFKVGGETGSKYFVLQVHYGDVGVFKDKHKDCSGVTLHLTNQKQPLIAGMYLMMSVDTVIPPGEKEVNADIACHYKTYPMHPFAYRVHTHHLGKVVSGYRVRDGQWTPIGHQSPQLPQAFYPVENPVEIKYGDILAARCVFTGEGRSSETYIGGTARDEMCNFYIMYYMEAKYAVSSMTCTQNIKPEIFKSIPQEANIPIPVKPDMTMMAHGHNEEIKNEGMGMIIQQPKREEEEVLDQ